MRTNPSKKKSNKNLACSTGFVELSQIVKKHPVVKRSLQNVTQHVQALKSPVSATMQGKSERNLFFNNKTIRILKTSNNKVSNEAGDNKTSYSQSPKNMENTLVQDSKNGIDQI